MEPGPAEIPPGAPHSLSRLHLPSSPPPQRPPLILHLHPQSRCPRAADKTHCMAGPPQTSRGHLRWHCPPFHWSLRPSMLLVPFSLHPSPENTRTLLPPCSHHVLASYSAKKETTSREFHGLPATCLTPTGGPGGERFPSRRTPTQFPTPPQSSGR